MDKRERFNDPEEQQRIALEGLQVKIWTAIPGIVHAFRPGGPTGQIVDVQPSIKGRVMAPDGSTQSVNLPMLLDCPVGWQGGGGVTLTFPIKPGDECLVVFASRCIDAWWALGGIQEQAELRMHDLSDGFAFVGVRSKPRSFSVSTDAAQLRTDDGQAYIEINPTTYGIKAHTPTTIVAEAGQSITATAGTSISATAGTNITANAGGNISATAGGSITATATASATVNAPTITLNGNVTINGSLTQTGGGSANFSGSITATGNITGQGTSLHTHTHSGVTPGGGNSGQPN